MRRRALSVLAAVSTALAGLVAAGPSGAAATAATRPPLQAVQMGDSFSSGNGAGTYLEKTCWRSNDNYGARVAREVGAELTNVACSGGVVADLVEPRELGSPTSRVKTYSVPRDHADRGAEWLRRAKADELCGTPAQDDWYYTYAMTSPAAVGDLYTATLRCQLVARPQVDAVDRDTDLVFLTIGGNDIGFTTIVTQCMVLREPGGCRSAIEAADAKVATMADDTRAALAEVHRRSRGHAKVYLLGYPYLLDRASYGIPEVAPVYDAGAALRALQQKGDRIQRSVVAGLSKGARKGAFTFVDVKPSWGGHDHGIDPRVVADNRNAWLVPVLHPGREYKEWVHPTSAGWGASALALRGALR